MAWRRTLEKRFRNTARWLKRSAVGCFVEPNPEVVMGTARSSRPVLPAQLAVVAAEKEAADPTLHPCGCCCPSCKEKRLRAQQLPRALDFAPWATSNSNATSSGSGSCCATASVAGTSSTSLVSSSSVGDDSRTSSNSRASTSSTRSSASKSDPFADVPRLIPSQKPDCGTLLKPLTGSDNRTVWRMRLARWAPEHEEVVVKAIPCHSAARATQIAAAGGSFWTPSGEVAEILRKSEALAEARMAVEVSRTAVAVGGGFTAGGSSAGGAKGPLPHWSRRQKAEGQAEAKAALRDVFVQPLHVAVRPCSLASTPHDAGHDLEVVIVYPYYADGDGRQYMFALTQMALGRMLHPTAPLHPTMAALGLAQALYEQARDMLGLAWQAHERGFILNDNKPENLVFVRSAGGYQLIDAESVQRCAPGCRVAGRRMALSTPHYAAPEQTSGLWADRRSDVYSCGRAVQCVLEECVVTPLRQVLGYGTPEYGEVVLQLLGALEPLMQLAEACTRQDPAERPTAAEGYDLIDRYLA